jgi:hypothetical protein
MPVSYDEVPCKEAGMYLNAAEANIRTIEVDAQSKS